MKNLNIKSLNHVLKDVDPSFHIFIAFINWLVHGTGFMIDLCFFSYLKMPIAACRSVS